MKRQTFRLVKQLSRDYVKSNIFIPLVCSFSPEDPGKHFGISEKGSISLNWYGSEGALMMSIPLNEEYDVKGLPSSTTGAWREYSATTRDTAYSPENPGGRLPCLPTLKPQLPAKAPCFAAQPPRQSAHGKRSSTASSYPPPCCPKPPSTVSAHSLPHQ